MPDERLATTAIVSWAGWWTTDCDRDQPRPTTRSRDPNCPFPAARVGTYDKEVTGLLRPRWRVRHRSSACDDQLQRREGVDHDLREALPSVTIQPARNRDAEHGHRRLSGQR